MTRGALIDEDSEIEVASGTAEAVPGRNVERVLGRIHGAEAGPTLVFVAGLHGNETAGVEALQRVLAQLAESDTRIRGDVVALAGNRRALAVGRRFIERDLNRAWTTARMKALRERASLNGDAEDREQAELLSEIERAIDAARGSVTLMDLHTTSGHGGVFSTISDRLPNRAFGLAIPAPLVLGLEEQVDGTMTEFFDREGHVTLSFESGQHEDPESVDRAEDAIWIALEHVGLLREPAGPAAEARRRLKKEFAGLPRVVEVRHRHPIDPKDEFAMLEGYRSFQTVRQEELLGHDRNGPVRTPEDGRLLMPLYQEQGEDGFFLVREFKPFWLAVSERMRRWNLERFVHLLPGIARVGREQEVLYVNRLVARWYALELLHLLGYRKEREGRRRLIVVRRERNGEGPS